MMVLVIIFKRIILCSFGDFHATKCSLYDMVMTDDKGDRYAVEDKK